MAGDWIKFRPELFTHPKFLRIYNQLAYCHDDGDPGMLEYACGEELTMPTFPVGPDRNETVTEKALQRVTHRALRDVTMCALLRVWASVNDHCSVDGMDAILNPIELFELDDIAGFSGFGDAMKAAGWVIENGSKSLRFPNFREFNEPACLRRRPKTAAERQRDFRLREAFKSDPVTNVTKRNAREEKRREEKSNKDIAAGKPRQTWLTPFGELWEFKTGGVFHYAKAAKVLKSLVDKHGTPEVLARLTVYIDQTTDHGYLSLPRFAETYGNWTPPVDRTPPKYVAPDPEAEAKLREAFREQDQKDAERAKRRA